MKNKIILLCLILSLVVINIFAMPPSQIFILGTDGLLYPVTGDTATGILVDIGGSISIDSATITSDTAGLLGVSDFNEKVDTKTSEIYNIISSSAINNIDSLVSIYNKLNIKFDTATSDIYNIINASSVNNLDSAVLIYNELKLIKAELNYANDTVLYDSYTFIYGLSADGTDSVIYSTPTSKVEKLKSEVATAIYDWYGLTDGVTDSRKGKIKSITY